MSANDSFTGKEFYTITKRLNLFSLQTQCFRIKTVKGVVSDVDTAVSQTRTTVSTNLYRNRVVQNKVNDLSARKCFTIHCQKKKHQKHDLENKK